MSSEDAVVFDSRASSTGSRRKVASEVVSAGQLTEREACKHVPHRDTKVQLMVASLVAALLGTQLKGFRVALGRSPAVQPAQSSRAPSSSYWIARRLRISARLARSSGQRRRSLGSGARSGTDGATHRPGIWERHGNP